MRPRCSLVPSVSCLNKLILLVVCFHMLKLLNSVRIRSRMFKFERLWHNLTVHPRLLHWYLFFPCLLLIHFLYLVLTATTTGVFKLKGLRNNFPIYPWLLDILRQFFKAFLSAHQLLSSSSSSSRIFKLERLWHNFSILPRLLHGYLLRQLFQVFSGFYLFSLSIMCFSNSSYAFLETLRRFFSFAVKLRRDNFGFEGALSFGFFFAFFRQCFFNQFVLLARQSGFRELFKPSRRKTCLFFIT